MSAVGITAACVPCMVVGNEPASIPTITITAPNLGHAFYDEVAKLGARHRTHPAIFLLVWCAESGLDPSAVNPGGARGLNQMMPATLAWLGAPAAFEKLSGVEQLPWIERFLAWNETVNHGPFTSAVRCYVGNFWPAALARPDAPTTLVVDRDSIDTSEAAAYAKNKSLDTNGDGKITQADLAAYLARVRRGFDEDFALLDRAIARRDPSLVTWPEPKASSPASTSTEASVRQRRDAMGFFASLGLLAAAIVVGKRGSR